MKTPESNISMNVTAYLFSHLKHPYKFIARNVYVGSPIHLFHR